MKKNLQTTFSTRQYMLSEDFEIYYYNDTYTSRHYYSVDSHTHDYYEFYFFLEGDVSMNINGKFHELTAGDVILIPPDIPHHAALHGMKKPYRRFVFWISKEYCSSLSKLSEDYVYLMQHAADTKQYIFHYDIVAFNVLQFKVFQLIEEIHSKRFGKTAKVSLCVNDLILHINRSIYEMNSPSSEWEQISLYQKLIQYIEEHLDEDLTLDTLASRFYVSKFHIAHVFKENLGLSIHQFIVKKRLYTVKDMILTDTEISKAYMMGGFKDYSSFFRAFKKEFGMSPKEYKELFLQKPDIQSDVHLGE